MCLQLSLFLLLQNVTAFKQWPEVQQALLVMVSSVWNALTQTNTFTPNTGCSLRTRNSVCSRVRSASECYRTYRRVRDRLGAVKCVYAESDPQSTLKVYTHTHTHTHTHIYIQFTVSTSSCTQMECRYIPFESIVRQ
jgi:hypothetical protein